MSVILRARFRGDKLFVNFILFSLNGLNRRGFKRSIYRAKVFQSPVVIWHKLTHELTLGK